MATLSRAINSSIAVLSRYNTRFSLFSSHNAISLLNLRHLSFLSTYVCQPFVPIASPSISRNFHASSQLQASARVLAAEKSAFGDLFYTGPLNRMVTAGKTWSLLTSVAGVACQAALVHGILLGGGAVNFVMLFGFSFIVVTPFMLHLFTGPLVHRLYYDAQSDYYTAVTLGILLQRRVHRFTARDTQPSSAHMGANLTAKGRPLQVFINALDARGIERYIHMMRYDRPVFQELLERERAKTRGLWCLLFLQLWLVTFYITKFT